MLTEPSHKQCVLNPVQLAAMHTFVCAFLLHSMQHQVMFMFVSRKGNVFLPHEIFHVSVQHRSQAVPKGKLRTRRMYSVKMPAD